MARTSAGSCRCIKAWLPRSPRQPHAPCSPHAPAAPGPRARSGVAPRAATRPPPGGTLGRSAACHAARSTASRNALRRPTQVAPVKTAGKRGGQRELMSGRPRGGGGAVGACQPCRCFRATHAGMKLKLRRGARPRCAAAVGVGNADARGLSRDGAKVPPPSPAFSPPCTTSSPEQLSWLCCPDASVRAEAVIAPALCFEFREGEKIASGLECVCEARIHEAVAVNVLLVNGVAS